MALHEVSKGEMEMEEKTGRHEKFLAAQEVKILGFHFPLNVNLKQYSQHKDLGDLRIQLSELPLLNKTSSLERKPLFLPNDADGVFVFTSQNYILNTSRYASHSSLESLVLALAKQLKSREWNLLVNFTCILIKH